MITTHEATKYENYLPVDDLLAPGFSYERVNSFFFFTFRTVSRICDYIRSIQKMETSNLFLFYFFFSCPPSDNFKTVIPEMYREGSPIGWTIREFVLQVEIPKIFSKLPYARRGDDNLHRISSLATGEAPSGTHCRIPQAISIID